MGTNDPRALLAELVRDDGGIALPALHGATVRRVTKGGMVIRGTEIVSRDGPTGGVEKFFGLRDPLEKFDWQGDAGLQYPNSTCARRQMPSAVAEEFNVHPAGLGQLFTSRY